VTAEFVHGLERFAKLPAGSTVVTVGTFDGIHRGHQAIFQRVREVAASDQLKPVLVTFHPHPRAVVTPDNIPMLLTTIEEKQRFVPCFFDGTILVVHFNESVRNLTAEQFVKQVLVETVGVKHLVVGYDHGLGRDRGGNTETLERLGRELGFTVEVVRPVIWNDAPISSTRATTTPSSGSSSGVSGWGRRSAILPRTFSTVTASCCRPKVCMPAGRR